MDNVPKLRYGRTRNVEKRKPIRNLLRKAMPLVVSIFTLVSLLGGCTPTKKPAHPSVDRKERAVVKTKPARSQDSKVKKLLKALRNKAWNKGWEAIVKIGKPAVPELIEALKDKDARMRYNIIRALSRIGDRRAVPALIEIVKQMDSIDPWDDAKGFMSEDFGNSEAEDAAIRRITDMDYWVPMRAAWALGELRDTRAIPILAKGLSEGGREMRETASEALVEIGKPSVPAVIKVLNGWRRWEAARALGTLNDPRAVPALIKALKDNDETVRRESAVALGKIRDRRALSALRYLAKNDHDKWVRKAAENAIDLTLRK